LRAKTGCPDWADHLKQSPHLEPVRQPAHLGFHLKRLVGQSLVGRAQTMSRSFRSRQGTAPSPACTDRQTWSRAWEITIGQPQRARPIPQDCADRPYSPSRAALPRQQGGWPPRDPWRAVVSCRPGRMARRATARTCARKDPFELGKCKCHRMGNVCTSRVGPASNANPRQLHLLSCAPRRVPSNMGTGWRQPTPWKSWAAGSWPTGRHVSQLCIFEQIGRPTAQTARIQSADASRAPIEQE